MPEPKPTYIVDDDVAVRESMSSLLEAQDLPVRCFASAEEFLMAAPLLELGCVVSDIRMPGTDGIELIESWQRAGSISR
jgi:two-component system, LuxR family, response regulator FixJ